MVAAIGSGGCEFPDDVRYGLGGSDDDDGRTDGRAFVDQVRRRRPVTSPSHADDDLPPPPQRQYLFAGPTTARTARSKKSSLHTRNAPAALP